MKLGLVLISLLVTACAVERKVGSDGGVHPDGFSAKDSPAFHGDYLISRGYPLSECRECHGDDYGGGAVGVSCNSVSCHSAGVEGCATCHDGKSPPQPTTGGHLLHTGPCGECHMVPKDARAPSHPDGETAVLLSGLAMFGNQDAAWDSQRDRCVNTYCHGEESPRWDSAKEPTSCDTCHSDPPAKSHLRFVVAASPTGCLPCHPSTNESLHIDGKIDFVEPTCSQCHGKGETGAPPPSLDGLAESTASGVGAHIRHLSDTVADRIGKIVACSACHNVPPDMRADGHIDDAAPADVVLFAGEYDSTNGSCVVGCHWNQMPGPKWTDATGAARACDACHGFPPVVTRSGAPHPEVEGNVAVCSNCHVFQTTTHVDGNVDFLP